MKASAILLIVIFNGCGHGPNDVQRRIVDKIEETCGNQWQCSLDMSGTTTFDWDTFYFFRSGLVSSEISEMINTKVDFSEEFSYKYVFLLDGQVVHTEEHLSSFDGPPPGTISMLSTDQNGYFALIKKDSLLNARIDRRRSGTTYYLTCSNCDQR